MGGRDRLGWAGLGEARLGKTSEVGLSFSVVFFQITGAVKGDVVHASLKNELHTTNLCEYRPHPLRDRDVRSQEGSCHVRLSPSVRLQVCGDLEQVLAGVEALCGLLK